MEIYDPTNRELYESLTKLIRDSSSLSAYIGPGPALFQFNQFADAVLDASLSVEGKRCIEIGCGFARPYGLATLLYLCGAKSVIGIDEAQSADPGAVANTILLSLLISLLQPELAGFDKFSLTREALYKKVGDFNLHYLFRLQLEDSVPTSVRIRHCRFDGLRENEKEFDVAVSSSVFEHVDDMFGLMTSLRTHISAGGFVFTGIDYRDHRIYSREASSPWQYLVDDGHTGHINKIRHSQMVEIFRRCGFSVRVCTVDVGSPSVEEREKFLPKYAHLSEADLETLSARVLLFPV